MMSDPSHKNAVEVQIEMLGIGVHIYHSYNTIDRNDMMIDNYMINHHIVIIYDQDIINYHSYNTIDCNDMMIDNYMINHHTVIIHDHHMIMISYLMHASRNTTIYL